MRHYFKCFVWKTSFHPFISSVVIDVIMLIVTDEETKTHRVIKYPAKATQPMNGRAGV